MSLTSYRAAPSRVIQLAVASLQVSEGYAF